MLHSNLIPGVSGGGDLKPICFPRRFPGIEEVAHLFLAVGIMMIVRCLAASSPEGHLI